MKHIYIDCVKVGVDWIILVNGVAKYKGMGLTHTLDMGLKIGAELDTPENYVEFSSIFNERLTRDYKPDGYLVEDDED
jgi:hypothetical protein